MTQAQKIGVGVAILAILGAVALGIYGNSRTASPLENAEIYVEPAADAAPVKIYVHVTGAVRAPDVYELPVEARAWQAVQAAGGLLENADEASANLAAPLSDGARLEIPFRQPVVEPDRPIAVPLGPPVDVNRATAEQLKTLPGIGDEIAGRIIKHRTQYGPFRVVDDLIEVPGIGEAKLRDLRKLVTVQSYPTSR